MPYVRCPICELTSYVARGHAGHGECPRCSAPLRPPRRRFEREAALSLDRDAFFDDGIIKALALARRQLGMDLAFVGELEGDREILRWVSGDAGLFGFRPGGWLAADQSYCRSLLDGELGCMVPDTAADPRVRDRELTRSARIGAYVGVPLEPFDHRTFALCCLARTPRPELGEEDVRFLRGLGETVIATLEAAQAGRRAWTTPLTGER